ncbi:MAG: LpxL/LpxP family Kdo(2)-lipid IV(A) lauroyl/palmitoleoyl acyltransferase [Alcanivoracaceae bacterium]
MSKRKRPESLAHPVWWPTWLGVSLFWLMGQLPWNLLLAMGRGIGRLSWYVAGSRRRVAQTNVRLCFPELDAEAQQALAHQIMVSTGEALTEMAGAFCNQRIDLGKRLDIVGREHLEAPLAEGKGVLMLGMHFNTIDVGSRLLGKVRPFSVVYKPNKNRVLDWLIKQGRSEVEHYIDRDDLRSLVRHLKAGRAVWYAPDQDYGMKHAVFAPFFGVPAATITATSRIVRMSGAVVVPVAHYRLPGGQYRIEFGPIWDNFPSGDDVADCTRINSVIEHYVRKAPEQYLWVHRRFKNQPDGKNPYK